MCARVCSVSVLARACTQTHTHTHEREREREREAKYSLHWAVLERGAAFLAHAHVPAGIEQPAGMASKQTK